MPYKKKPSLTTRKNRFSTNRTKQVLERLRARMLERDQDCSAQENGIDKGYHLAVLHMCEEIDRLLEDIH